MANLLEHPLVVSFKERALHPRCCATNCVTTTATRNQPRIHTCKANHPDMYSKCPLHVMLDFFFGEDVYCPTCLHKGREEPLDFSGLEWYLRTVGAKVRVDRDVNLAAFEVKRGISDPYVRLLPPDDELFICRTINKTKYPFGGSYSLLAPYALQFMYRYIYGLSFTVPNRIPCMNRVQAALTKLHWVLVDDVNPPTFMQGEVTEVVSRPISFPIYGTGPYDVDIETDAIVTIHRALVNLTPNSLHQRVWDYLFEDDNVPDFAPLRELLNGEFDFSSIIDGQPEKTRAFRLFYPTQAKALNELGLPVPEQAFGPYLIDSLEFYRQLALKSKPGKSTQINTICDQAQTFIAAAIEADMSAPKTTLLPGDTLLPPSLWMYEDDRDMTVTQAEQNAMLQMIAQCKKRMRGEV